MQRLPPILKVFWPRRLFIRIFLWFWLSFILVVSSGILTINLTTNAEDFFAQFVARRIREHEGPIMLQALANKGQAGLKEEIERWKHPGQLHTYLLDLHGKDLAGQQVPAEILELAMKANQEDDVKWLRRANSLVIATILDGDDHARYMYVSEAAPPPPLPSWRGPWPVLFSDPARIMWIFVSVVITAGIVCYALARYVIRPVERLTTTASLLAEGDLAVRVGHPVVGRPDEIGELGRSFDRMADRIESLVSAQRRLFQDMSHELRSPLARLNMALGLIAQQAGPQIKDTLDRMERDAQRLNSLVGQLLTFARLDAGVQTTAKENIDLAELVGEVVVDANFEARGRDRRVVLVQCDECAVIGAAEVLRRAIENVVRNGIHYTPAGSQVEVSLTHRQSEKEGQAVIRVRDHGPGVPAEEMEAIFRPFYRVGGDRNRQPDGAGLGLAIAQQAVRLHGGTITAVNASQGGLIVELNLLAATTTQATSPSAFATL